MLELTEEQRRVFDLIIEQQNCGRTPTVREIASQLGYKSPNNVTQHLRLIEKKGYIRRAGGKARAIEVLVRQSRERSDDTVAAPLVGTIAAGTPVTAIENIEGMIALDRNMFSMPGLFCLRVKGDSMKDVGIFNGDTAIMQKQSSVDDGEVAAVVVDDEATLKRVIRRNGRLLLRAENADYEDITLSPDHDVNIAGRLVGVLRKC